MKSGIYDPMDFGEEKRGDTFPLGPPVKARHGQAWPPGMVFYVMSSR